MSGAGATGAGAGGMAARPPAADQKYICGSCGSTNALKARDQVRCRACGYRIFYKVRTERCECAGLLCCVGLAANVINDGH